MTLIEVNGKVFARNQRVRIKGIADKGPKVADRDLNGRTGKLTFKFEDIPFGKIGCYIDDGPNGERFGRCNLNLDEFEIVKRGEGNE